jgi:ACS family hexuronate transporter-like MFS transporter
MLAFALASAINYLDRSLLGALQPTLEAEFSLTAKDFGFLHSAFYVFYAVASPFAGLAIDRFGLNSGIIGAVSLWSAAGIATGFAGGLSALVACRIWLGVSEAAVIPGYSKANGLYVDPSQRALGAAMGQFGLAIGMASAPLLASFVNPRFGWRWSFVVAGVLGFLWVPLWLWVSRTVPPARQVSRNVMSGATVWKDRRIFGLMLANMLGMTVYSLWSTWTTKFLVQTYGLPQDVVNFRFAWIPPIFSVAGGVAGGVMSYRLARSSGNLAEARFRSALTGAIALLSTALAPHAGSASAATLLIGFSFFWSLVFSVNVYSLPLDLFGPERAASGTSALTGAFGLMSVFISPLIGASVDHYGFAPACGVIAVLPLAACGVLRWTIRAA